MRSYKTVCFVYTNSFSNTINYSLKSLISTISDDQPLSEPLPHNEAEPAEQEAQNEPSATVTWVTRAQLPMVC